MPRLRTTTRFGSLLKISWDGRSLTELNEAIITVEPVSRYLYLALILSEHARVDP